jgi:hypothetical protein
MASVLRQWERHQIRPGELIEYAETKEAHGDIPQSVQFLRYNHIT